MFCGIFNFKLFTFRIVSIYKLLPLRVVSRFWGYINNVELPYWLRQPLLLTYIWFYNIDMSEAQVEDVKQYKNLGQLFCRKLKPHVRPIDFQSDLVSPVDGRVLHCGLVSHDDLEQVKGVKYSLSQFLGPGCERILDLHLKIKRLPPPTKNRSSPNLVDDSLDPGLANPGQLWYNSLTVSDTRYNPILGSKRYRHGHVTKAAYPRPSLTGPTSIFRGPGDDTDDDDSGITMRSVDDTDHSSLASSNDSGLNDSSFPAADVIEVAAQTAELVVVQQTRDRLCLSPENELYYAIVYLAPGDYHGFHSPVDWLVVHRRHFPGELFSVCPSIVRWVQGLFNFNERVVFTGTWKYGFFSMAAVGATNVGSIKIHIDQELKTNLKKWKPGTFFDKVFLDPQYTNKSPMDSLIFPDTPDPSPDHSGHDDNSPVLRRRRRSSKRGRHSSDPGEPLNHDDSGVVSDEGEGHEASIVPDKIRANAPYTEYLTGGAGENGPLLHPSSEAAAAGEEDPEYRNGIFIHRGECFGEFNLGSTVVLIFEAPKNFAFDLEFDQTLLMGRSMGHCA